MLGHCRSCMNIRQLTVGLSYGSKCLYGVTQTRSSISSLCIVNTQLDTPSKRYMSRFNLHRKVEINSASQRKLRKLKPDQPPDPHLLKVSIIGAPNAGKSTLANQLIGWRFASVSQKVHTTRHTSVGVVTESSTQVVILDTPGLITDDKVRKHKLEKTLLTDPYSSLFDADHIIAMVDVSQVWNRSRLDRDVLTALSLHSQKPAVLVLNKVDLVRHKQDLLEISRLLTEGMVAGQPACHFSHYAQNEQREEDILDRIRRKEGLLDQLQHEQVEEAAGRSRVLEEMEIPSRDGLTEHQWWQKYLRKVKQVRHMTRDWRGWPRFDRIFMVSASAGDGVEEIKQHLLQSAKPSPWLYNSSMITDMDPMEIVHMCVREKLLDNLPQEVPYQVEIHVRNWEMGEDSQIHCVVNLVCKRNRDMVRIIGANGNNVKKICGEVKQDLMNTFRHDISLKLRAVMSDQNQEWA